jgi:hypothetical protein
MSGYAAQDLRYLEQQRCGWAYNHTRYLHFLLQPRTIPQLRTSKHYKTVQSNYAQRYANMWGNAKIQLTNLHLHQVRRPADIGEEADVEWSH